MYGALSCLSMLSEDIDDNQVPQVGIYKRCSHYRHHAVTVHCCHAMAHVAASCQAAALHARCSPLPLPCAPQAPPPTCPVLLLPPPQMVQGLVPHLQAIAQEGSPLPPNIRRHALMVLHHLLNALSNMRGAFQKQVRWAACLLAWGKMGWDGVGWLLVPVCGHGWWDGC